MPSRQSTFDPSAAGSDVLDWSEMEVKDLNGTELEWSTIAIETRPYGIKQKRCLFCDKLYTGGPSHIREHLDASVKHRHVSSHLIAHKLIVFQHAACKPLPQWADRHGEILCVLQARAAELADQAALNELRTHARAKSVCTAASNSTIDAALLQRPSADQVKMLKLDMC